MLTVSWWRQRFYPQPCEHDPLTKFLAQMEQEIGPDKTVLDIGAGAGELNAYNYRGRVKRVVGIDLDPRVTENPLLDHGVVASAYELPFADASFDLAFCIYVLEHIDNAERFAQEVGRVLKPGGVFLCLTPNKFHYVPLIASLTPHSFHEWYNRLRGRADEDTFPTCYRLNSRGDMRRHFTAAGFDQCDMQMVEAPPNYLMFSVPTFLAGVAYERVVGGSRLLQDLRVNIIGRFQKASSAAGAVRKAA